MEHLLHLFTNGCGEGAVLAAFVSEWPIIGAFASRFLNRLRKPHHHR